MKEEIIDGKTTQVFHSREELKWYFHDKMCKGGGASAFYDMERAVTEKDVNKWLEPLGMRVKMLDEWLEEIAKIPTDTLEGLNEAMKLPDWVFHIWKYGLIRKTATIEGTLPKWWLYEKDIKGKEY